MTRDNLDRCLRTVDDLVCFTGEAMQNDRDPMWGHLYTAFVAIEQALLIVERKRTILSSSYSESVIAGENKEEING